MTGGSPPFLTVKSEKELCDQQHGGNGIGGSKATPNGTTPTVDSVNLSLASLLGGDQLSFLQLLATAAVAHQQLQLQAGQHPSYHHQQKKQQQQPQQQQQQHHHLHQSLPKPSKADPSSGSNGVRYSNPLHATMVSSPPATSTQHLAYTSSSSSSSTSTSTITTTIGSNSTHSTNGPTTASITAAANCPVQALLVASGQTSATGDTGGSYKKRRPNSSSNDKENLIYRNVVVSGNGVLGPAASPINAPTQGAGGGAGYAVSPTSGSKVGHHNHQHHHNNNNTTTNNKNINDIFDKVYKKPAASFAKHNQPGAPPPPPSASLATILRTAPPSAVEEDNRLRPAVISSHPDEGEQFSLADFLKNHTEVSISTVGGGVKECEGEPVAAHEHRKPPQEDQLELEVNENSRSSSGSAGSLKRKSEGERNPRKQQQPRRIDEFDTDTLPAECVPKAKAVVDVPTVIKKAVAPSEGEITEPKHPKRELSETIKTLPMVDDGGEKHPRTKLADIRDKHMIQLVTRRRCCRICQNTGKLEHLDNCHYHSKISLMLHTRWRHQQRQGSGLAIHAKIQCRQCGAPFGQRYKLILHQKRTHHHGLEAVGMHRRAKLKQHARRASECMDLTKGSAEVTNMTNGTYPKPSVRASYAQTNGSKTKKKQRKRKARSRCFTRRRK